MRVRFIGHAWADLNNIIVGFEDDPARAGAVIAQIESDAHSLEIYSRRYPVVAGTSLGEIRKLRSAPYVILYRISANEVQVLAVAHERSDWLKAAAEIE